MKHKEVERLAVAAPERSPQNTKQEGASYSQLAESVTLARATLLARRGKLKQAEMMLLPFVSRPQVRTSTLDLAAKVYAQQGKIKEARTLWLRALLQVEPSDTHILYALLRCAESLKGKYAREKSGS